MTALKDENRRYIGIRKPLPLDNIIDRNGILPDGVAYQWGTHKPVICQCVRKPPDKFIKHTLHIKYYVRYMDDFIILPRI